MKAEIETKPGCIQHTLTILGDKWTALIIRDLSTSPRTFSELEQSLDSISPRTLSQRLEKLCSEGIAEKNQYCEKPYRCRYQLTSKGQELETIVKKMADWGANYC